MRSGTAAPGSATSMPTWPSWPRPRRLRGSSRLAIHFTRTLALERVSYSYAGAGERVLVDVDLTMAKGEAIAIVGASGAGKSTLVDLLLGLLEPTAGQITVDGRDIAGALRSWQRLISYVPQEPFIIDDTLRRNIAFGIA